MPATFAHPAAILPFRRFTAARFDFAALVIGSMAPDFGYYVQRFDVASYAHGFAGSVLICVPFGFAAYAAFRVVRAPVIYLLPLPHRSALMSIVAASPPVTPARLWPIGISILFGAWTHCVWDSFTHKSGWVVQRIAGLQETVFRTGVIELPGHHLLQHASTLLGTAILTYAYLAWLRVQPRAAAASSDRMTDRTRYLLLGTLAVISLAVAVCLATPRAAEFSGYFAVRVFLFRTAVYATATFMPLLVLIALALYSPPPRRAS